MHINIFLELTVSSATHSLETADMIRWLKIKRLKHEKVKSGTIIYMYNNSEQYKARNIHRSSKVKETLFASAVDKVCEKKLDISEAKKNNLVKICQKQVDTFIPS